MNSLSQYPLVRLVIPFAVGIIAYLLAGIHFPVVWFFNAYAAFLFIWFSASKYVVNHYSLRWVFGVWVSTVFMVAGYNVAQNHNQLTRANHFSHFAEVEGNLLFRIIEPVSEKTNSFQVVGKVEKVLSGIESRRVGGKLILYLQKDSLAQGLKYGDYLLVENNFQELTAPKNPHEFNYARFLSYRNIFHQSYRASGQWHATSHNRGSFILKWSDTMRQKALEIFESNFQGSEFAIISALFLGYREYLDENLRREFVGAGAMHILCVSGLHVGIIFLVLKMIFAFLLKLPRGKIWRAIAIILVMWMYAAVTGFSPSVLRACTMFSFVAIGQSFNRKTNIYNTLAASALVLLVLNPYIIASVGFQLSYLAVISIVALQPYLYKQLIFKNWFLDKAWAIITVSLAAQLATGPLSLFYFNQFPNYFLVTNLAVIPLAGVIIYAAIATLVMYPVPLLGFVAGKVLYFVLLALHQSVKFIEGLPYSTSTNVFISFSETIAVFLIIILLFAFLMSSLKRALVYALVFSAFVTVSISARSIVRQSNEMFVVYSVSNSTVIDFISGRKSVCLMCENLMENPGRIGFHVSENRVTTGVSQVVLDVFSADNPNLQSIHYSRKGPFIAFGSLTIFVLDETVTRVLPAIDFAIDYLIVTSNARHNPQDILENLDPSKVIVDASNSFWNTGKWVEACNELGVEVWPVRERGAYVWRK